MKTDAKLQQATLAGGCFWCMEGPFEALEGVVEVVAGYTGGSKESPTYEDVCSGKTGHVEAIQITFDSSQVSFSQLLEIFWRQIDPTDLGGQFADRGSQYATAIFYQSEEQKKQAEESKKNLEASKKFDKPIVTKILPAQKFYKAEEYHQDYHKTNPLRYKTYRQGSERDVFLKEAWAKKDLTPLQYAVTCQNATERPFENEFWNNKREGIYVDIISGELLFSSRDKFDSGTGWPSFTKPLKVENVVEKKDDSLSRIRTEVRSKKADSHLGHLFNDGPAPTGLRYCINSASLRFIPKEDLEKEGYGAFLKLFN